MNHGLKEGLKIIESQLELTFLTGGISAGKPYRAHATQVDPNSPFWFGLPDEHARTVHPFDDYVLVRSLVGEIQEGIFEDDLFKDIRA